MFSSIEQITVQNNKYYIHKEILKQYHYFDVILGGNFQEKEINLEIDFINFKLANDFTLILDIMYSYHYNSFSLKKKLKIINFSEFMEIYNFIKYLQPNDNNILDYLILSCPGNIIELNKIGSYNLSKDELLQLIKIGNKINLKIEIDNYKCGKCEYTYKCINQFFEQFNIIITQYYIIIDDEKNNILNIQMKINNTIAKWYNLNNKAYYAHFYNNRHIFKIDATITLINYLIDNYLLKNKIL